MTRKRELRCFLNLMRSTYQLMDVMPADHLTADDSTELSDTITAIENFYNYIVGELEEMEE